MFGSYNLNRWLCSCMRLNARLWPLTYFMIMSRCLYSGRLIRFSPAFSKTLSVHPILPFAVFFSPLDSIPSVRVLQQLVSAKQWVLWHVAQHMKSPPTPLRLPSTLTHACDSIQISCIIIRQTSSLFLLRSDRLEHSVFFVDPFFKARIGNCFRHYIVILGSDLKATGSSAGLSREHRAKQLFVCSVRKAAVIWLFVGTAVHSVTHVINKLKLSLQQQQQHTFTDHALA